MLEATETLFKDAKTLAQPGLDEHRKTQLIREVVDALSDLAEAVGPQLNPIAMSEDVRLDPLLVTFRQINDKHLATQALLEGVFDGAVDYFKAIEPNANVRWEHLHTQVADYWHEAVDRNTYLAVLADFHGRTFAPVVN